MTDIKKITGVKIHSKIYNINIALLVVAKLRVGSIIETCFQYISVDTGFTIC